MASHNKNVHIITDDKDDDVQCLGSRTAVKSLTNNSLEAFVIAHGHKKLQNSIQSTSGQATVVPTEVSNSPSKLIERLTMSPSLQSGSQTDVLRLTNWEFELAGASSSKIGSMYSNLASDRVLKSVEAPFRSRSTLRSPSPLSKTPNGKGGASSILGYSPSDSQRKRPGDSFDSTGWKRRRQGSASTKVDLTGDDTQIISRLPATEALSLVEKDSAEIDEKEIYELSTGQWRCISPPPKSPQRLTVDYRVIDLDALEDALEEEALNKEASMEREAEQRIDFWREARINDPRRNSSRPSRSSFVPPPRNEPVRLPWVCVESLQLQPGIILKSGQVVEGTDGDFFHIVEILHNPHNSEFKLRGHELQRSTDLNGLLPRKVNELCWTFDIDLDDNRHYLDQSMTEVLSSKVLCPRQLRITNQLFPACSFRGMSAFKDAAQARQEGLYVARWKLSTIYRTARDRLCTPNRFEERRLEHVRIEDLPENSTWLAVASFEIRARYRGETALGGAHQAEPGWSSRNLEPIDLTSESDFDGISHNKTSNSRSPTVIDLADDNLATPTVIDLSKESLAPPASGILRAWTLSMAASDTIVRITQLPGQKYTYGDCFCGAGGATRGAVMAGLKPKWGFDFNNHACISWGLNFPDAHIYQMSAHDFFQQGKNMRERLQVDVLHLSPPCQYFSPAKTIPGVNDEMNLASLFACGDILDIVRPRIVTLEQTFGIVLLVRFQSYFKALIKMFTDRSFSVRWKIAFLQNWGLPQRRQRLIMIASCPGEVLPEFPAFTHSDPKLGDRMLLPWVSVNSVLRSIPEGAPNHEIGSANAKGLYDMPPWDGDSIAPRCITTHGGQNYHPSGTRHFTNREFAALQGFPHNHVFSTANVKKQIGNAVPPSIAKILFESIRKQLEKVDGVQPEQIIID